MSESPAVQSVPLADIMRQSSLRQYQVYIKYHRAMTYKFLFIKPTMSWFVFFYMAISQSEPVLLHIETQSECKHGIKTSLQFTCMHEGYEEDALRSTTVKFYILKRDGTVAYSITYFIMFVYRKYPHVTQWRSLEILRGSGAQKSNFLKESLKLNKALCSPTEWRWQWERRDEAKLENSMGSRGVKLK